jgi:IrrE N-terminal-like domain
LKISRIDLSEAGSPERLVAEILKIEGDLGLPVPIKALCKQLDIHEIGELETEGFEGCLITDLDRHSGSILVKGGIHAFRQRFIIAHELGHFLIPSHIPSEQGRFLCSAKDLQLLEAKEGDRRARMELEANRFASLILMPPPRIRAEIAKFREPDLQHIPKLSRMFEVSKEAMVRTYALFFPACIAILMVKDGILLRMAKSSTFPFITTAIRNTVPKGSLYFRKAHEKGIASDIDTTMAGVWVDVPFGKRAPELYEQVLPQRDGYALIMLWLEAANDDEEDNDERTSAQRYRDRQDHWRR